MIELISLILNLLLGGTLITTLIFYSSIKRKHRADAASVETALRAQQINLEQNSILFLQSQLSEAYTEIDKMQEIINRKRDEIIELIRRSKELEIEMIEHQSRMRLIQSNSCSVGDCPMRVRVE